MSNQDAVLVTGATSGIGQALCRRYGREGLHVLAHVRNADRGAQVVAELTEQSISAELLVADLAAPDGATQLVQAIAPQHRLVAVVNNAGGGFGEKAFRVGEVNDPLLTYRVNVFAAYEITTLAAARMPSGSIVNISSIHAHAAMGGARIPLYSSAKAAVSHLTKLLAVKLAPHVRVNAVSPGRTRTNIWGEPDAATEEALIADSLIHRWITPDEIADAAWSLHANGACTGVDLIVDGGMGLSPVRSHT